MGHGPELKSEVFSFVTLYNTFIHTKRAPDTRGRFSHLMGAGPYSGYRPVLQHKETPVHDVQWYRTAASCATVYSCRHHASERCLKQDFPTAHCG